MIDKLNKDKLVGLIRKQLSAESIDELSNVIIKKVNDFRQQAQDKLEETMKNIGDVFDKMDHLKEKINEMEGKTNEEGDNSTEENNDNEENSETLQATNIEDGNQQLQK